MSKWNWEKLHSKELNEMSKNYPKDATIQEQLHYEKLRYEYLETLLEMLGTLLTNAIFDACGLLQKFNPED